MCGDGKVASTEDCDDGNTKDDDGCNKDCKVEDGWECRVPSKPCVPVCGDSQLKGTEECDDGNGDSEDGCSSTCLVEPGADCPTPGQKCTMAVCGNGVKEKGELCDCGTDPDKLPDGCASMNGLFYGDGKGCSKTCTFEPKCKDDKTGVTQACSASCGDGNVGLDEECDDGNLADGDGCSSDCKKEQGFDCSTTTISDASPCSEGGGKCLVLPIIYRDFLPENASSGGHPDFYFLGTKYNKSTSSTTVCVPNSGGPAKGNDSTARCWGIAADKLANGKPQPGPTKTCDCQFSDWNINNSSKIAGNYTIDGNDSPLTDGKGGYLGGAKGSTVSTTSTTGDYKGTLKDYVGEKGGPVFAGTTPAYKNADSFKQWFNDDPSVNKTFIAVLEMPETSDGSNTFQFASKSHLADGGFYPLDTRNPSQATLCNLWPYWNHGNGNPIWGTTKSSCKGDQYLFSPRATASDCVKDDTLDDGCWVTSVQGYLHDNYFTDEARYYFVYSAKNGMQLDFYGDDDLFIYINGVLVLDLGGVHQQLPGHVEINSDGDAKVSEGGCLNTSGKQVGNSADATDCSPTNTSGGTKIKAKEDLDFRNRVVKLGLKDGNVYEIAIFGADRHPPESNYQLTLSGYNVTRSICKARCGDGVVSGGEECDFGDDDSKDQHNDDNEYGGCTTECKWGPYCGDGKVQEDNEQCDDGRKKNGTDESSCAVSCKWKHFCGDGNVDVGEQCDLGKEKNETSGSGCTPNCTIVKL